MRSSDTKRTSELDPRLFKPEALDPETAKFNAELADLHRHPDFVLGYVLEGKYRLLVEGAPEAVRV
jgi:hypothetical protein